METAAGIIIESQRCSTAHPEVTFEVATLHCFGLYVMLSPQIKGAVGTGATLLDAEANFWWECEAVTSFLSAAEAAAPVQPGHPDWVPVMAESAAAPQATNRRQKVRSEPCFSSDENPSSEKQNRLAPARTTFAWS
ncbi:hypothetical protein [Geobacter anodireducens]